MSATQRKRRCKPKPRPEPGAATGDTFTAILEEHAREKCKDERVSAWLLALVAGDREDRVAEQKGQ